MKRKLIFSRRVEVNFKRGPTGYLRQDPSDEAKKIKNNPDFQDRSPALREDKVKENAHSIVLLRGGDVTDKQEVLGEYLAQFGKYKGKSFRWILENDVGYVVYLTHKAEEEERAGQFNPDGLKKESLLSFLEYSRSFTEIVHLLEYISKRPAEPDHAVGIDDTLVGFGVHSKKTWREIWENRANGYATFILQINCVPGSKMFKLQQYLQRRASQSDSKKPLAPTSSHPSEMEADEELETMMLSLSPSKLLPRDGSKEKTEQKTLAACPPAFACHLGKVKAPAAASQPDQSDDCSTPVSSASGPASLKPPLPVPPELLALKIPLRKTTPPLRLKPVSVLALLPGTPAASSASSASPAVTGQSVLGHPTTPAPPSAVSAARDPPAQSHRTVVPPMPSYEQDMSRWNCSHQQRIWMKTEMESLGLWPGSRPVRHPMNMISLWCNPPQPELIDSIYELPSPKYFQLHPFFIWKPISQSNKAETVLMSTPGFLVYQGNTSTVPVKSSLCTKQKE